MRLPGVHFTTRRLLVAVILAALLFGIVHGARVASARRSIAEKFRDRRAGLIVLVEDMEGDLRVLMAEAKEAYKTFPSERPHEKDFWNENSLVLQADIQKLTTWIAYYATLEAKYERASRRPWLLFDGPDPPPPEP